MENGAGLFILMLLVISNICYSWVIVTKLDEVRSVTITECSRMFVTDDITKPYKQEIIQCKDRNKPVEIKLTGETK